MHNLDLNLRLYRSLLATIIIVISLLCTTVSCRSRTAPVPEPATRTATVVNLPISVGKGTAKVGETVAVQITLHDVITGLSGYDIEVSLENEKIARIVNVVLPDFGLKEIGNLPSSSVRIKAVDLSDTVPSGSKKALLATLELEGIKPGTTDITVFVRAMDDDDGNPIEPDISQGHIEVVSSTTTLTSTDTPESIPTKESEDTSAPKLPPTEGLTLSMGGEMTVPVDDSTAIELKLHNIDKGLSGYDVTISVENEELAKVVNVVLPNFGITEVGDLPNSSVRIRVIDLNDIISLQMEEALLATLELEGMKLGTSEIVVSIRTMDDDSGNHMKPDISPGNIEVVPVTSDSISTETQTSPETEEGEMQVQECEVISHDDGSPEFGFMAVRNVMGAVRFGPCSEVTVSKLKFHTWGDMIPVKVCVLDSSQSIIFSQEVTPSPGWYEVDVSHANVIVEDYFYVGWMWITEGVPGSWLGVDKNGPPQYRSYLGAEGNLVLSKDISDGSSTWQENYMIRVEICPVKCIDSTESVAYVTQELSYDDGSSEVGPAWPQSDSGFAVQFTPSSYPARIIAAKLYFHALNNPSDRIQLEVLDDNLEQLYTEEITVSKSQAQQWITIDLQSEDIVINSGDFFIAVRQLVAGDPDIGSDTSSPTQGKSWQFYGNHWSRCDTTNYMIRAIVSVPES